MRQSALLLIPILAAALVDSPTALAQHATGSDLYAGQQAYSQVCANCHGPDGNLIANVDLGHGVFRQDYSDAQLVAIIKNGIPNTPMPPNPAMSEEQAGLIVAYLRSRAIEASTALAGNAANGKALFEGRGNCLSCHMVAGQGSPLSTELTRIALTRSSAELETSLRNPAQEVLPNQRFFFATTTSGEEVTGRLLNQDRYTLQMLDTHEKLRSFKKTDLREFGFTATVMPPLDATWSDQDVADLVAYLASLRGPTP